MTLNDILLDSSSYLDLEVSLPTGTELDTRIRFANKAVREWANASSWKQLKTEETVNLSSFASVALPNFVQFVGPPMRFDNDGIYTAYPEIRAEDRFYKQPEDQYCYITGNDSTGYSAHFNALDAGATLTLLFMRGPSTMATLSDVCEVPDGQFVTERVISSVLQSRNDERFPIVQAEGNRLLKNMIGAEMYQLPGGVNTTRKIGASSYSIGS